MKNNLYLYSAEEKNDVYLPELKLSNNVEENLSSGISASPCAVICKKYIINEGSETDGDVEEDENEEDNVSRVRYYIGDWIKQPPLLGKCV